MSTKRLLGGLGQGMMQLGATYGQTSLANLEADAQRMKEERLATMQIAQFGLQSSKDIYQMEMGEKKFALLEDEAARKAEESEYQKSLRGKGTWEWKEIEDKGWYQPGANQLEEGKWIKGPKRYAWVNSVTREVKYVDGSTGTGTGTGTPDGEVKPFEGTKSQVEAKLSDIYFAKHGRQPTKDQLAQMYKNAEKDQRFIITDGKTPPPPPEVDRKLIPDSDEFNKMFPTPGADIGETWIEHQIIPDLGTKIADGAVTAAEAVTDPRVMSAVYGYPVDVVTWAVNQFLPADMVIDKPALGSKMWGEWLEALAPHYEKGKQLTKEEILKIVPVVKDISKGDLTYAIDKWNELNLGEKASRLKKWGETIIEDSVVVGTVSEGAKKAVNVLTEFIGETEGNIASALEALPSKEKVIEIVESWPTPDKVNPEDVPSFQPIIDAIKAQIENATTGTTSSGISEVAVEPENGLILNPVPSVPTVYDDDAVTELPSELPVGFGQDDPRIDDGPGLLDIKVALDPTQRSRRWDTSRGRQGEGGLSMDADYSTLPGTLSREHGQDDPQEAGTMNRAEIKALLDPTQRHRQEVETDIFKMSYDESIEIIRGLVSNLVESGMSNTDVIDQLFRIVEGTSKSDEKKFNKSDYKKALHDIIIGLHTQNK